MERVNQIALPRSFYTGNDVTALARQLLGKFLYTCLYNQHTGGLIMETEAYAGTQDQASHAWGGRRTKRTEIMYAEGGVAYVYLCYGIHALFNIVTNEKDMPDAILIRGIYPTHGLSIMEHRLNKPVKSSMRLQGPGLVSKALGISTQHSGILLKRNASDPSIWLEEQDIRVPENEIITTPRIGVAYAGTDAALPYRYLWTPKKADSMIP